MLRIDRYNNITCTLVFAQVQQEVRGSAGRRVASPRPPVPQELYVALGTDIGVHHFLPVASAVRIASRVIGGYIPI